MAYKNVIILYLKGTISIQNFFKMHGQSSSLEPLSYIFTAPSQITTMYNLKV